MLGFILAETVVIRHVLPPTRHPHNPSWDSLVFYRHPHNALLGGRNIPVLASLLA